MKTSLLLAVLVPVLAAASPALADDTATCVDAATKGQRLRDTHKLVEAREQLRVCAAAQCPSVVQQDCAGWLAQVEAALPSVVLKATSGSGGDLVDVTVTVDGQAFASRLDGQAVDIDAGPHTFHFASAAGATDKQVVVTEGQKNQPVAVVIGTPEAAPPATGMTATTTPASPSTTSGGSNTMRTVGFGLGGVGVIGLGVGAVFGAVALADKSSANCNANNVCDPGTTSGIKSAALISDIGWIAGGVLLATGVALVVLAPKRHASTVGLKLAPVVTASGGSVVLGGAW